MHYTFPEELGFVAVGDKTGTSDKTPALSRASPASMLSKTGPEETGVCQAQTGFFPSLSGLLPVQTGAFSSESGLFPAESDAFPSEISISLPERSISLPEKSINLPERSISLPERSISLPERSISLPERSISLPERSISLPESGGGEATELDALIADLFRDDLSIPSFKQEMIDQLDDVKDQSGWNADVVDFMNGDYKGNSSPVCSEEDIDILLESNSNFVEEILKEKQISVRGEEFESSSYLGGLSRVLFHDL
jgi:hypothetical protein